MSPRKQPLSLFDICIRKCIRLVNSACDVIQKESLGEFCYDSYQESILKRHLMMMLPARLFDVLCSERTCCQYIGDIRFQISILTHPKMTVFRKRDIDCGVPHHFWLTNIPKLRQLLILDLRFVCTDEILAAISKGCPLLEELNIVSRVDIYKSPFNASVLIRNVSDAGLSCVSSLKRLRVLALDPPRNERANRIGRCVSQSGIIMLISELPNLEELKIESCDVASTLIYPGTDLGPLNLKKVNFHFASPEGIQKLLKICPLLEELSVTHLTAHDKDAILDQICVGDWKLSRLDLSFFSFTESVYQLLTVKGSYLTHFSLWEIEHSLTLEAVLDIGLFCPNLTWLSLMTQSKYLVIPRYFRRPKNIFTRLKSLTLGNENFDMDLMLVLFLSDTNDLQRLILKYQSKVNFDTTLLNMVRRGNLRSVEYIWLDCTFEVSKDALMQAIQACEKLQMFTVECAEISDVRKYVSDSNLDLKLGSY